MGRRCTNGALFYTKTIKTKVNEGIKQHRFEVYPLILLLWNAEKLSAPHRSEGHIICSNTAAIFWRIQPNICPK